MGGPLLFRGLQSEWCWQPCCSWRDAAPGGDSDGAELSKAPVSSSWPLAADDTCSRRRRLLMSSIHLTRGLLLFLSMPPGKLWSVGSSHSRRAKGAANDGEADNDSSRAVVVRASDVCRAVREAQAAMLRVMAVEQVRCTAM